MPNVCLAYKPYVGIRTKFLSMLKNNFCLAVCQRMPAYASVCQRMPPCLKRIQPMPNVPLAYVSVYQRMSDIFHTLAYASTIRYSVTGPLDSAVNIQWQRNLHGRTCAIVWILCEGGPASTNPSLPVLTMLPPRNMISV